MKHHSSTSNTISITFAQHAPQSQRSLSPGLLGQTGVFGNDRIKNERYVSSTIDSRSFTTFLQATSERTRELVLLDAFTIDRYLI